MAEVNEGVGVEQGLAVEPIALDPTLRVELNAVEDAVVGDGGLVDPPGLQELDLWEPRLIGPEREHLYVRIEVA